MIAMMTMVLAAATQVVVELIALGEIVTPILTVVIAATLLMTKDPDKLFDLSYLSRTNSHLLPHSSFHYYMKLLSFLVLAALLGSCAPSRQLTPIVPHGQVNHDARTKLKEPIYSRIR